MSDFFTHQEQAKLVGFKVPVLSADFTDRVIDALPLGLSQLPERQQPRLRSRHWRRAGIALIGIAGAGAVSVATATTLFGVPIRNVPVVGYIVEKVSPQKPELVERAYPKDKAVQAPVAIPKIETQRVQPASELVSRRDLQLGAMAERLADRLDSHDQRRREAGLPPRPPKMAPEMLERLAKLPPEDRRALFERIHAIRTERGTASSRPIAKVTKPANAMRPRWMSEEEHAAVLTLPKKERRAFVEKLRAEKGLGPLALRLTSDAKGSGRLQAYLDSLTPEERAHIVEEMKRRRAQRKAQNGEGSSPPERLAEEPVVQPLP